MGTLVANGARILIIDDEDQIRRLLQVALEGHGFKTARASSGKDALRLAATFHSDLIILDLGLPDIEGMDVLREIRGWSSVPIIVLSVQDQESNKIKALDSGADDYVTKPFGMEELFARIRVALRHAAKTDNEPIIQAGDITLDLAQRVVKVKDREIKLTPTEYDILKNLAVNEGRVLTHGQLLREIWGEQYQNETHYLRVYVGSLRRKIEADPTQPRHIITEPGVGYRLVAVGG